MQQDLKSGVLSYEEYGNIRDDYNRKVVEIEKKRRVSTRTFTFLFETRETVLNQINEMIYLEKITSGKEIDALVEIYSSLLPDSRSLSVSMFIDISDPETLARSMVPLSGVEKEVYLVFDGSEIHADYEEGRSTDTLESTLQYLRFNFTPDTAARFRSSRHAFIECRKKGYEEAAGVPAELLGILKSEIS
ncbi:MAG: DUF3501 family protein [Candidatus Thermoplasmatota archaeon]|jgi:hypothetical protein|nr:DUF3501 family protein [Candidatus Thermoplasmatota archaeon]MCL5793658.1 DUF3501 family protein [Candidatus Thermoplasmatota archaeon]